jgi:hypothetical protein
MRQVSSIGADLQLHESSLLETGCQDMKEVSHG